MTLCRWPVARTLLGLVLLTAAASKGHQLATAPLPQPTLLSRPLLVAVVEVEFLLALWLFAGVLARAAWLSCRPADRIRDDHLPSCRARWRHRSRAAGTGDLDRKAIPAGLNRSM